MPLIADLSAGVEATIRESKDRRLLIILNTRDEPAEVPNIPNGIDLLCDAQVEAACRSPPMVAATLNFIEMFGRLTAGGATRSVGSEFDVWD